MHGLGTYTWSNGRIYFGDWKKNKKSWKETYANGVYDGEFLDGKVKLMKRAALLLSTPFRQSRRCLCYRHVSYETLTLTVDQVADCHPPSSAPCMMMNAQRNGKGTYVWLDDDCYEGNWINNNRHGHGKMTWSDGRVYIGQWKFDKEHGKVNQSFQSFVHEP